MNLETNNRFSCFKLLITGYEELVVVYWPITDLGNSDRSHNIKYNIVNILSKHNYLFLKLEHHSGQMDEQAKLVGFSIV